MLVEEIVKNPRNQFKVPPSDQPPIVLIHGLWMTPLSWEGWAKKYRELGYDVIIPSWKVLEGKTVEQIRKFPNIMRGIGLHEIMSHFEDILRDLNRPPILMGHSFGGLFVQLLLDKGFGSVGVAIHSAPVKGIWKLPLTTIRSAWPALKNPLNVNGIFDMNYEQFKYAFANDMPDEESRAAYDRYYIPTANKPLIESAFANLNPKAHTKVDFNNLNRSPLLFVAGDNDRITPAALNRENAFHYHGTESADYVLFRGRNHFTIGQEGWEEVADYCLQWSVDHIKRDEFIIH